MSLDMEQFEYGTGTYAGQKWDGESWLPCTEEEMRAIQLNSDRQRATFALASTEYLHSIALVLLAGVVATPFLAGGAILTSNPDSAPLGFGLLLAGLGIGIGFVIGALVALRKGDHRRLSAWSSPTQTE